MSSVTLDIPSKDYYMVIVPLNGSIYFFPCNLLTTSPLNSITRNAASLEIKDSCITNRNRDEILSIGDQCIEDYMNQFGPKDCVFVDNLIDKMFQAITEKQSQPDNDLIQLFMDHAILQAIRDSGAYSDVNEEALKSWMYIFVTPIGWGKRVTNDALFSVFAGSRFITPSSALMMAAFDTLLLQYLQRESYLERNTLFNSKNILCELSIGKTGDATLSMDVFSITKLKGLQRGVDIMTIDPSLSIPTLFSNNQIQLHAGYKNLVALLRDAVKETIGLSMQFCNELLNQLCSFLDKLEKKYQGASSKRLDRIYPFQDSEFPSSIVEEDISALRLISLTDIHAVLSSQWELIMPEIHSLIETQVCITRVYFTVIPEVPHLYPEPIEDALFISIMLLKFKLEAISTKKFKYIYDNYKRFRGASQLPYTTFEDHTVRTLRGVGYKLKETLQVICQESLPLSSLAPTLNSQSNIDTINYVYLSTSQVRIQSLSVDASGRPSRLRAQESDIIALGQFLVMDTMESKFEETMLQFHISKSALSLLETLFPKALHEFATLNSKPKEEPIPDDTVADVSRFNLENWYNTLYRKYDQLFHSESRERCMNYSKVMADLLHHHLDSDSPRVYMTHQKHIGTFLMVYLGYLKETLARDFGQDSDSTRYILIFEHLMRNVTIGHTDDKLMKKALDRCGWVPETEKNKRKLMIYDIEDNFPISECLQQENIKMIPAKTFFAVVTITRYYAKICISQALEDILPTDKHYKALKAYDETFPFDFYETICDKIWHHVLESIYEAEPLLEYPTDIDIMDLEFTLESYKSFKVAFMEYMLNTFPFTYTSHPDEKHRFPLHLKQGNYSIVLTSRLVLLLGLLPTLVSMFDLSRVHNQAAAFVFYRPSNFDDEKNLSLPMLRLIEIEAKKLLDVRFRKNTLISQRRFSSVHSHQYLKIVSGNEAFGYDALKEGVIRFIKTGTFALGFQYLDNDKASLVEAVTNQPSLARPIGGSDACILSKIGAPWDNTKKQNFIPILAFEIPNFKDVLKIHIFKINDALQRNVGDIVAIQDHDHTILSTFDFNALFFGDSVEEFMSLPFLVLQHVHSLPGYMNLIFLYSSALNRPVLSRAIIRPQKLAYFDSYEVKQY